MIEVDEKKSLLDYPVIKVVNNYLVDYFSFIVVYVILVMFVIGYFYILNPKYQNIVKNNQLHQIYKEEEIRQLSDVVENYQSYKNLYNAISEADKNKVNNFLPQKDDSEELLIYIRSMMDRGGYKLLSLDIGSLSRGEVDVSRVVSGKSAIKKTNKQQISSTSVESEQSIDSVGVIDISLSIGSLSYSSLKELLAFIERDSRFFDIYNIDFSLTDGVVNLQLKTYYLN